jgi:hypothetical protein
MNGQKYEMKWKMERKKEKKMLESSVVGARQHRTIRSCIKARECGPADGLISFFEPSSQLLKFSLQKSWELSYISYLRI